MFKPPLQTTDTVFSHRELWILILGIPLAIVLGFCGYADYYAGSEQHMSMLDLLYKTVALFTFGFYAPTGDIPWYTPTGGISLKLEVARWLAPALLGYAVIIAVLRMLHGSFLSWRIRWLNNHTIVCGLDEQSWLMTQVLITDKIKTVVIESNPSNVHLDSARRKGAYVIVGDPKDSVNLINARVLEAKYLLALTAHDLTNSEVVIQAYQLKKDNPRTSLLNCMIHIHNSELAAVLYDDDIFSKDYPNFSAGIINAHQKAARWLLNNHGPDIVLLNKIKTLPEIKILLLGTHDFTEALILQLAKLGHYGKSQPIHITLVGPQVKAKLTALNQQHSVLSSIIKISAKDTTLSFLSPQTTQQLIDEFKPNMVYLCAADTKATLIWSKLLARLSLTCPIIVCQFSNDLLAKRTEPVLKSHSQFTFVYPTEELLNLENIFNTKHDQLATTIHNNYVTSQIDAGDTLKNNPSLSCWRELLETLKDANRNQADHLEIKCRIISGSLDYTAESIEHLLEKPEIIEHLACMEHERWVAEKLLDGWILTDGPKNTDERLSPCLKDWDQLPESERQKDRDSVHSIPQLLREIKSEEKTCGH